MSVATFVSSKESRKNSGDRTTQISLLIRNISTKTSKQGCVTSPKGLAWPCSAIGQRELNVHFNTNIFIAACLQLMVPSTVFCVFFLSCTIKVSRQWRGMHLFLILSWTGFTSKDINSVLSIPSYNWNRGHDIAVSTKVTSSTATTQGVPELNMNPKHSGHMEMQKLFFHICIYACQE